MVYYLSVAFDPVTNGLGGAAFQVTDIDCLEEAVGIPYSGDCAVKQEKVHGVYTIYAAVAPPTLSQIHAP